MPRKSLSELEAQVGDSYVTIENFEVEAGKVAEFARAVEDDNPAHQDADAAQSQGFDAIPAPLTFTRTAYFPRYRPEEVDELRPFDLGFDLSAIVHGQQEYEFARPVTVGDVLTGEVTLMDVYQREGSGGQTMTFAVLEFEYRDANDEVVVTERQTIIETRDTAGDHAKTEGSDTTDDMEELEND